MVYTKCVVSKELSRVYTFVQQTKKVRMAILIA